MVYTTSPWVWLKIALGVFLLSPLDSEARLARRRDEGSLNTTAGWSGDPQELVKRDGSKYVFMHHVSLDALFSS